MHWLKLIITSIMVVMSAVASAASVCQTTGMTRRVAVIGGSLGGLAAAHALYQTGWKVDVYERAPGPLHNKGSGLGFVHVPAWEALLHQPMMRRNRRASRHQGSFYYGDLWKFLYDGLPTNKDDGTDSGISVKFGKTITELKQEGGIDLNEQQQQQQSVVMVDGTAYDLVIVCDGGFSSLRKYVLQGGGGGGGGGDGDDEDTNKNIAQQPQYAGYVVWRGSIPESILPKDVLFDIKEGVYKNGIYDTIVLKMAKDNGEDLWTMGSFVATPEDEISQYWNPQKDGTSRHNDDDNKAPSSSSSPPTLIPDWFLSHFEIHFHQVPGLVRLMECMVQMGEIKPHPQYEFGATTRVGRGRVILLGDAAHMASPRTAVGAHTAIMDALALREAFDRYRDNNGSIEDAIEYYSKSGVSRAQELYARTREVSHQFIPSGGMSKIISPQKIALQSSASNNQI